MNSFDNQQPEPMSVSRVTFNYLLVAIIFLVVGIFIGNFLASANNKSPSLDDIENVVVGAVTLGLSQSAINTNQDSVNPEELEAIVRKAVAEMEAGNDENAKLADDDPYFGSLDAPVTIVEFSDFNCSFCGRFASETLPRIRDTYGDKIRFVYRDMPILTETSSAAAQAGMCANDQNVFWEFHNYMFENTTSRTREDFIAFAESNNIDVAQFTDCYDTGKYSGEVTLDLLDGQALGIRGTPAFYVNGRVISGAQPFEVFQVVIDAELKRAESQ